MGEVILKEQQNWAELKKYHEEEREILLDLGLYPYAKDPARGYHEVVITDEDVIEVLLRFDD